MSTFFIRYQTILRWLPALLVATAIFGFSATPGDEVQQSYHNLEVTMQIVTPAAAPADPATASVPPAFDWLKAGHVVGYFWLGLAVLFALPAHSRWSPAAALILCSLYAVSDEFHQIFDGDDAAVTVSGMGMPEFEPAPFRVAVGAPPFF